MLHSLGQLGVPGQTRHLRVEAVPLDHQPGQQLQHVRCGQAVQVLDVVQLGEGIENGHRHTSHPFDQVFEVYRYEQ